MSDDLIFGDDLFTEPEGEEEIVEGEEAEGGEGQNKTFLIAVIGLGSILVCTLLLFAAWILFINPRMQAQQQAALLESPTPEVVAGTTEESPVGEETPAEEAVAEATTPPPTDTPTPRPTATPTPVVGPTNTPTPSKAATSGEGVEGEAVASATTPTPTRRPRRTPTPTPTPRATPTPRSSAVASAQTTPDTGLGETLLVIAGLILLIILFAARRLRKVA